MVFGQKSEILSSFVFHQNIPKQNLLWPLDSYLRLEHMDLKGRKFYIFPKGFGQKWEILSFFIRAKYNEICQKKVFCDLLDRKLAILA